MPDSKVVIVVPCYNEARRLRVDSFLRFLEESPVHFLFVNDGSKDDTGDVLHKLQATRPDRIEVLDDGINRGKGEAVRNGIVRAMAEGCGFVGFWDADLATPLEEIPDFLAVFQEWPRIEMVFGARIKLLGRHVERKAARHYLGRVFATVVSNALRLPIYDTQCGAKIFRVGPDTRGLFDKPFDSRWVFDVELIARFIRKVGSAQEAASRIYELPLRTWEDVVGSKLKPFDFFVGFTDVARIWWRYIR